MLSRFLLVRHSMHVHAFDVNAHYCISPHLLMLKYIYMINTVRNISAMLFAIGLLTLSGGLVSGLSAHCPNPTACFSAAVGLITSDHNLNSTPRYSEQAEEGNVGTLSHYEQAYISSAQNDQFTHSAIRDAVLLVSVYLVVLSLLSLMVLESIKIHYLRQMFTPRHAHRRKS